MKALVISCVVVFVSFSFQYCSTVKKASVSCPEFSGTKINTTNNKIRRNNKLAINLRHSIPHSRPISLKSKNHSARVIETQTLPDRTEYLEKLEVSANNVIYSQTNICDTIFLRSGSFINGRITRKGLSKIRYRDCNNLSGPIISVRKSDVLSVRYGNDQRNYPAINKKRSDPVGILGFAFSVTGLLFLGSLSFPFISLILTGCVLGWISSNRIKNQPEKLKGRGLAEISIVLGYALLIFLALFLVIILIGKII
jgi:hypothetical protein